MQAGLKIVLVVMAGMVVLRFYSFCGRGRGFVGGFSRSQCSCLPEGRGANDAER